jgi:hypothetical protein
MRAPHLWEERFAAVGQAAAEALTERGPGFDVTASWGGATIPTEADAAKVIAWPQARFGARAGR